MLKLLKEVVNGLEVTYNNYGVGGTASTFQLLEICHTHYWSREFSDSNILDFSIGSNSALSQVSVFFSYSVKRFAEE